ncbi:MAG: glutamate formimidoyltransferase [Candidatus Thermoplasmatota archaeon]|nr:glutamate formimidoyltransferase [Candidatus Thermoplasmatota archaeon]
MNQAIIECVPNISEGRDKKIIDKIVASIEQSPHCSVLSVEPDADYNRTVVTIAGKPDEVYKAAYQLIRSSIELIDMTKHSGEHPRLGVVDVCPFIPLSNYTMEDCARLAENLAREVSSDFGVSTYLYGYAATRPDRRLLSALRKGEYEGLKGRMDGTGTIHSDATKLPDFGAKTWSNIVEKSGAITIGARDILVAYNVNVNEPNAVVAKKVGSIVRGSGRLIKNSQGERLRIRGMVEEIQGIGVTLEAHSISQVSMNILDVNSCPLHKAFEICQSIAADHDTELLGSELVGLVPLSAMLEAGRWYSDSEQQDEEFLVKSAIEGLGLSQLEPFDPHKRIIEWALRGDEK